MGKKCLWEYCTAEQIEQMRKLASMMKVLRTAAGYTQDNLSKKVGISRQTINDVENKKRLLSWHHYLALLFFF